MKHILYPTNFVKIHLENRISPQSLNHFVLFCKKHLYRCNFFDYKRHGKNNEAKVWQNGHETSKMNSHESTVSTITGSLILWELSDLLTPSGLACPGLGPLAAHGLGVINSPSLTHSFSLRVHGRGHVDLTKTTLQNTKTLGCNQILNNKNSFTFGSLSKTCFCILQLFYLFLCFCSLDIPTCNGLYSTHVPKSDYNTGSPFALLHGGVDPGVCTYKIIRVWALLRDVWPFFSIENSPLLLLHRTTCFSRAPINRLRSDRWFGSMAFLDLILGKSWASIFYRSPIVLQ